MSTIMSCKEVHCQNEIEGYCESCPETLYLCLTHMSTHKNKTKHIPKFLDPEHLKILSLKFLKSKIKQYIFDMANDTQKVITALKKATAKSIEELKVSMKNLKEISEYKPNLFSKERICFLIDEVGQISKDFENSTFNKLKEKSEMIEVLLKEYKNLKNDNDILERSFKALEKEKVNLQNENEFLHKSLKSYEGETEKYQINDFPIIVNTIARVNLTFRVKSLDLVETLKNKIELTEGTPVNLQKLIYMGRELEDWRTLSYYVIGKNSTIHLALKLKKME